MTWVDINHEDALAIHYDNLSGALLVHEGEVYRRWWGGKVPVDGDVAVDVVLRSGKVYRHLPANTFKWSHRDDAVLINNEIVGWKPSETLIEQSLKKLADPNAEMKANDKRALSKAEAEYERINLEKVSDEIMSSLDKKCEARCLRKSYGLKALTRSNPHANQFGMTQFTVKDETP